MKTFGNLQIFENLTEIVDPKHTALVVWDCQNSLVGNIFNRDEFIANLKALLAAARQKKIPTIYTKITPLPTANLSSWGLYQNLKRFKVDDPAKLPPYMKPGTPDAEINEAIAPVPGDIILPKPSSNIFFGTNFENMMKFPGIQTILFTGIATEYGIEHSARDASIRGFYPVIVSDCVSSPDKVTHEQALKFLPRLCLINTSKEIIKEW
jgi:nicotinamidase-related amidase